MRLLLLLQHAAEAAQDHVATPFDINTGLILWTLLVFGLLLALLWKFAWPTLVRSVEDRERRIAKRYLALAPPLPALAFPLLRRSRIEPGEPFFLMREVAGEANSETRIDVVRRQGEAWTYALHPVTGRKHQLRVHMAALGAPILGDRFYPLQPQAEEDFARPLKLLAQSLRFVDPVDGRECWFESGLSL